MRKVILILDLDGVLITTPQWKPDELNENDQYSKFNSDCIKNLNKLLASNTFEIWLSSTRRLVKTLSEFNTIFRNRGVETSISGFLPEYSNCKTRKDEIVRFLEENKISAFLIIDDDKSLNDLSECIKEKLVLTEYLKGFDEDKLKLALKVI